MLFPWYATSRFDNNHLNQVWVAMTISATRLLRQTLLRTTREKDLNAGIFDTNSSATTWLTCYKIRAPDVSFSLIHFGVLSSLSGVFPEYRHGKSNLSQQSAMHSVFWICYPYLDTPCELEGLKKGCGSVVLWHCLFHGTCCKLWLPDLETI